MSPIYLCLLLFTLSHSTIYYSQLLPDNYFYSYTSITQNPINQNFQLLYTSYFSSAPTENDITIQGQDPVTIMKQIDQKNREEINNKIQSIRREYEKMENTNKEQRTNVKLLINPYPFIYKEFGAYLKLFNKSYKKLSEYYYRQFIYYQNLQKINLFNQNPDRLFNMGLN